MTDAHKLLHVLVAVLAFALPAWAQEEEDDAPEPPPRASASIIVERDIPYVATPSGEPRLQSLDLYRPAGPTPSAGTRPIVLFVHGGGWRTGIKMHVAVKPELFTGMGYLFASTNYRLSPAVTHPAHVEDVAAAIGWLHRNAASRGGDPSRILLVGHSAGAHLVALVALDGRRLEAVGVPRSAIRGVVPLDGAGYDISRQVRDNPIMRPMLDAAFGSEEEGRKDASPATFAALPGAPAFLLVHAGRRPASAVQSQALAELIRKGGGRADVFHTPDKNHAGVNRDLGAPGDPLTVRVSAFAREVLDAQGSTIR